MAESEDCSREGRESARTDPLEIKRAVRIKNSAGLHARPCHAIVSRALARESDLWVECEGREVNGKSILELMTLSAPCDAVISFRARGRDAAELVSELSELVDAGFHEVDS
jgi:phosphocarrier protein